MRVAPIAFVSNERIRDIALETSALTHGHVTGQESAAAWALILAALAQGADLEASAGRLINEFGPETARALTAALAAPRDATPETVESLGGGWVAEEALSIALYACLCAQDFEHGLQIAVTHGGDSDSTGAIAGNALGLLFADQVQSHRWAKQVECGDIIRDISHDLALAMSGRIKGGGMDSECVTPLASVSRLCSSVPSSAGRYQITLRRRWPGRRSLSGPATG